MGWRTFRVRLDGDKILDTEFVCFGSDENNKNKLSCNQCLLCSGTNCYVEISPTIIFHSNGVMDHRLNRYIKGIKALRNKKKYRVDFAARYERVKEICKI